MFVSISCIARGKIQHISLNCTARDSCTLHHLLNERNFNCQCDAHCVEFGDCCPDALITNTDVSTQSRLPSKHLHCRKVYSLKSTRSSIYVIESCPANYHNKDIVVQCEQPVKMSESEDSDIIYTQIPVSSTRIPGLLYKNAYCARCHQDQDFIFWDMQIYASTPFDIADVQSGQSLTQVFYTSLARQWVFYISGKPGATTRDCRKTVNKCDDTAGEEAMYSVLSEKCVSGSMTYWFHPKSKRGFRNMFCAACNNASVDELICIPPTDLTSSHKPRFPSYSLLLDFYNGKGTIHSRVGVKRTIVYDLSPDTCSTLEIYDPFQQECRASSAGINRKDQKTLIQNSSKCEFTDMAMQNFTNLTCHKHDNSNDYQTSNDSFQVSHVDGYITLICSILSTIGLLLLLVVYFCFPALRNTPGLCVMSLSSSLLIAQLLFTFGIYQIHSRELCLTVALGGHYAYLCYFSWMNVLSFDLWRAFTRQPNYSLESENQWHQWMWYGLYGWLAPLIIVGLALGIDSTPWSLRPLYATHICWIGSKVALLVFFALPLLLVVCSDLCFFLLTARYICRTQDATCLAQQQHSTRKYRARFYLYIKLATVMGLTWMFGLLAGLIDVTPLWYVYTFFNCLQGIYLCFSFVCTRKVGKLCNEKLTRYRRQKTSTSQATKQTIILETQTVQNRSPRLC